MTEEQEIALLRNVKAITDHMAYVDEVFKAARIGLDMVLVFQCNASGLYFPADYVSNWGMPWGDGLGPDVCSETLQSNYHVAPPEITRDVANLEQIMHPLYVCRAQVDAHLVVRSEADANMAIPDHEDYKMRVRAPILRAKQLLNPAGRLARIKDMSVMEANFFIKKQGGWR